jgi:hypothetical protein
MTFLLLLGLLIGWLMLDFWFCRYIVKRITNRWVSWPFVAILFPIALVYPVSDELIAKRKFDKLCAAEEAAFKPVIVNAENRDLRMVLGSPSGLITDDPLPINYGENVYVDLATGEELIRYKSYRVKGGRLIHFLRVSNSNSPLTIGQPSCEPKAVEAILRSFRIVRTYEKTK